MKRDLKVVQSKLALAIRYGGDNVEELRVRFKVGKAEEHIAALLESPAPGATDRKRLAALILGKAP